MYKVKNINIIILALLLFIYSIPSYASGLQLSYKVSTFPGETFDSLSAAESRMRSKDVSSSYLERLPEHPETGEVYYDYEAPEMPPELGEWQYYSAYYGFDVCFDGVGSVLDAIVEKKISEGGINGDCPTRWELNDDWYDEYKIYSPHACGFRFDDDAFGQRIGGFFHYADDTYSAGELIKCGRKHRGGSTRYVERIRAILCLPSYNYYQGECRNNASARIFGKLVQYKNCEKGNPCDVLTGVKRQTETDFSTPSIQFTRTYHSIDQAVSDSAMGLRWHHSFDAHLLIHNTRLAGIVDGKGYIEPTRLRPNTDQEYVSNTGLGIKILPDGQNGWVLYKKDGQEEYYDEEGQLQRIVKDDNEQTFTYGGEDNRLSRVESQFGHSLDFTYNALGNISEITDNLGQSIGYEYDVNNNLSKVTYQDSSFKTYVYEDSRFPNHLTGIINENGVRYATWEYNDKGRAIVSEHAGGAERTEFTFVSPGVTKVKNELGFERTYTFTDVYNGIWRLASITDSEGTETYDYRLLAGGTKQVRLFSKIDKKGIKTEYTYGDYHMASKTLAKGTPNEKTITYSYSPQHYRKIQTITEPSKVTTFSYDGEGRLLSRQETVIQ